MFDESFLWELCKLAFFASVASAGTTVLGIVGTLAYPLADLMRELKKNGLSGMGQHWRERLKFSFVIGIAWWSLLFSYQLLYNVPKGIRTQARNIPAPQVPNSPPPLPPFWVDETSSPPVAKLPAQSSPPSFPSFQEEIDKVYVSFGHMTMGYSIERLKEGPVSLGLVNMYSEGSYPNITLRFDGKNPVFSFALYPAGSDQLDPIQIVDNKFKVKPINWDWNYNSEALEIVDQQNNPLFQMIRKESNRIQINGLFYSPDGAVCANDKGVANNRSTCPLVPIFKYPAWKFHGKYADGSN